jgi:hypothetical protein
VPCCSDMFCYNVLLRIRVLPVLFVTDIIRIFVGVCPDVQSVAVVLIVAITVFSFFIVLFLIVEVVPHGARFILPRN